MTNHYESPFSARYASQYMTSLFSAQNRIETWRRLWVELARAESERKKRETVVETARHNLSVATRNRMKIDEHKSVWLRIEAAEEERRAEGELEDFIVRKPEI